MTKLVQISKKGNLIVAPPSKSFAQRALFAATLSQGKTLLKNLGKSNDVENIKLIIEQIGCTIENSHNVTIVEKTTSPKNNIVNVGESGLGTRLATPILSHFYADYVIEGEGTLLKRPMTWFTDHLPQMGLKVLLNDQFLPLRIEGSIKPGHYEIDGSKSSQYISGLLMTLPLCKGSSTLTVNNPTSIPYIDITLSILADFGIQIKHQNYSFFSIEGGQTYSTKTPYQIEGDFSSAAFWIVYGLLNKGIFISNLNPESVQADSEILEVVNKVGGTYKWKDSILEIIPPTTLLPFNIDATHCPDLFPILVVLAAGIQGKSSITGTRRLIHKESNRKLVLLEEFSKLGLEMKSSNNSFIIKGTQFLESGEINSHSDHRIAMAFAIASILTPNGISISDHNCVNKSYPDFWKIIDNL